MVIRVILVPECGESFDERDAAILSEGKGGGMVFVQRFGAIVSAPLFPVHWTMH